MKNLKQDALNYHAQSPAGKVSITPTKPCATQYDLSLAYTPGVAQPVLEIAKDPQDAYRYTSKGNLVAVISNGTAALGLGNVGALACKPIMEGKGVLFKKFADIDVFDIEINCEDVDEFVQTVINIAPTFGGINLEDIKAPECFEIEQRLIEALDIPVFHDDQHGTAIITAAALLNALEIQNKTLNTSKIVCLGAGSAGIAILDLLVEMGADKQNIYLLDKSGVIRCNSDKHITKEKLTYARDCKETSLADAMVDADVFIGVAAADLLSEAALKSMAAKPIVFALSNPDPEIKPETANACRDDLIMATGRTDYPNQVNNVLGFPFIFRGALDARARRITLEMKIAAVHALKDLAKEEVPSDVLKAYNLTELSFGKDYIIPKPFDTRLIDTIPQAVYNAAIAGSNRGNK